MEKQVEVSLMYRLFCLGGRTPKQIEEAEAIIRLVPMQDRHIFEYLWGRSTAHISEISVMAEKGVRLVRISHESGRTGGIYGGEDLRGRASEIFDDRGRLTDLGKTVRIAWKRTGSPVRKEWLKLYPPGSNWQ